MKRTIKRAAIGFLAWMVLCSIISTMIAWPLSPDRLFVTQSLLDKMGSLEAALVAHLLLSGLFGAVCMAGESFYDIESWSMLQAAAAHFSTMMLAYVPIALCLGWLQPNPRSIALSILVMAVGYVLIWLVLYLQYKRTTQQLNELLEETKNQD